MAEIEGPLTPTPFWEEQHPLPIKKIQGRNAAPVDQPYKLANSCIQAADNCDLFQPCNTLDKAMQGNGAMIGPDLSAAVVRSVG